MTSQEQWNERPPKGRETSFIEKATWVGLGLLFGGAAVFGVLRFLAGPLSDDDRPPIIVRNGSVHIEESLKVSPAGRKRGKLTKNPSQNPGQPPAPPNGRSIWYHDYSPGKPAKLDILAEGLDLTVANCSDSAYFFGPDVTNATISYRYNNTERTVIVSIGGNGSQYLELNVDGNALPEQPPGKDFILDLDGEEDRKLTKVAVFWKGLGSTPDHTETCTFDADSGRVTVIQRK